MDTTTLVEVWAMRVAVVRGSCRAAGALCRPRHRVKGKAFFTAHRSVHPIFKMGCSDFRGLKMWIENAFCHLSGAICAVYHEVLCKGLGRNCKSYTKDFQSFSVCQN